MLWLKAFHLSAIVLWFSGLFYLPRLFVYHAMICDPQMTTRFKRMEKNLYYYITTPGALLTLLFGFSLIYCEAGNSLHSPWLTTKLVLVAFLLIYHLYLGFLLRCFAQNNNRHSHHFYRWINELPTVFLVAIVILAVIKPAIF
jgi:putative membrane protein